MEINQTTQREQKEVSQIYVAYHEPRETNKPLSFKMVTNERNGKGLAI